MYAVWSLWLLAGPMFKLIASRVGPVPAASAADGGPFLSRRRAVLVAEQRDLERLRVVPGSNRFALGYPSRRHGGAAAFGLHARERVPKRPRAAA